MLSLVVVVVVVVVLFVVCLFCTITHVLPVLKLVHGFPFIEILHHISTKLHQTPIAQAIAQEYEYQGVSVDTYSFTVASQTRLVTPQEQEP